MTFGEIVSINPFDDDNGAFFVSGNEDEQQSLWPTLVDFPAGCRMVYGEAGCAARVHYIKRNWRDIRPKSLRVGLGAASAVAK
jgi:uncharacterized protein YbdZ (MbtH family)